MVIYFRNIEEKRNNYTKGLPNIFQLVEFLGEKRRYKIADVKVF
jgi:hypothetical protein